MSTDTTTDLGTRYLQRVRSQLADLTDDQLQRLHVTLWRNVEDADDDLGDAMILLATPGVLARGERQMLAQQVDLAITGDYVQWIDEETIGDPGKLTPMCVCGWVPADEGGPRIYDLVTALRWLIGHRRGHGQPEPAAVIARRHGEIHQEHHAECDVYTSSDLLQTEVDAAWTQAQRLGPLPA